MKTLVPAIVASLICIGCETVDSVDHKIASWISSDSSKTNQAGQVTGSAKSKKKERGPDGTIAYYVQIETDEPGARIEANNESVGVTPMELRIFGDDDGTFHNFGSYEYVIRATPTNTLHHVQVRKFRTGGWFTPEDKIPQRIFIDTRFSSPPQE